jgi:hypothetical protein
MGKTATIERKSFFAKTEKPIGITIPEMPVFLQANCAQKGSWVLGEESLGNKNLDFFILAMQFGYEFDPYKDRDIPIGTIIFTPINCDFLRERLVYATKIKNQNSGRKGSLANFAAKLAEAVASGIDPRELVWSANFVNKSGNLPDGKPYNCSVISFGSRLVDDEDEDTILGHCVNVFEDDLHLAKVNNLLTASLPKFSEIEQTEDISKA